MCPKRIESFNAFNWFFGRLRLFYYLIKSIVEVNVYFIVLCDNLRILKKKIDVYDV